MKIDINIFKYGSQCVSVMKKLKKKKKHKI